MLSLSPIMLKEWEFFHRSTVSKTIDRTSVKAVKSNASSVFSGDFDGFLDGIIWATKKTTLLSIKYIYMYWLVYRDYL